MDLQWKQIKNDIRTFQLGNEPELIHIIRVRENHYLVISEDGYDLNTGKVDTYFDKEKLEKKYNIKL